MNVQRSHLLLINVLCIEYQEHPCAHGDSITIHYQPKNKSLNMRVAAKHVQQINSNKEEQGGV